MPTRVALQGLYDKSYTHSKEQGMEKEYIGGGVIKDKKVTNRT